MIKMKQKIKKDDSQMSCFLHQRMKTNEKKEKQKSSMRTEMTMCLEVTGQIRVLTMELLQYADDTDLYVTVHSLFSCVLVSSFYILKCIWSIHFLDLLYPFQGHWDAGAYPLQVTSLLQDTQSLSHANPRTL